MIEIHKVTYSIESNQILNDVNLSFSGKGIHVILGPSGCGKTTLLRLIAGLEKPKEGEIRIDGKCAAAKNICSSPEKRQIGFVFQNLALWPHMSVEKHLRFMLKGKRSEQKNKITLLLEKVRLYSLKKKLPHQLSGGEKQRLAIARSLITSPQYLLMDEPFSNLDLVLRKHLSETLLELKEENNLTVLYVTHNLQEAYDLADTVTFMTMNGNFRTICREELQNMNIEKIQSLYGEGHEE